MPKKAVFIFFLLAFLGAALFIYFTFPRTKEQIPTSENQRPYPSAPVPGPNGVPVPETVPHPNTPKLPPGPTLRVMAWAASGEARALQAEADAFQQATGHRASLTIENSLVDYRRDLRDALASDMPPDVCLIDARDFMGTDPEHDFADMKPEPDVAPRSLQAFTVNGRIKAMPDEFSVDMLFYNPSHFDRAGIGYPDRHWNWDIMEAITRALASLHLKDDSGRPIYPIELPADFNFWNILCMEAGHPALDLGVWHLADDPETKESQMRALDLLHEFFHDFTVTAPLPKGHEVAGYLFAQQEASLLIAPSELTATLPDFNYAMTLMPSDIVRASSARVNGWAVSAKSTQPESARVLAEYLSYQPVHAGWTSVWKPADDTSRTALCHEALDAALLPRVEPKAAPLAQFLDRQIDVMARDSGQKTDALYARIQTEYHNGYAPPVPVVSPNAAALKVPAATELRGL